MGALTASRMEVCKVADTVTKADRSRIMRQIKSKNTACEVLLRRALWTSGLRGYRIHVADIPGTPDIVFTKRRVAVFIDGCFWHGCPTCCRIPSTNQDYWLAKISSNKTRAEKVNKQLADEGWVVIRVWEHEVHQDLKGCLDKIATAVKDDSG